MSSTKCNVVISLSITFIYLYCTPTPNTCSVELPRWFNFLFTQNYNMLEKVAYGCLHDDGVFLHIFSNVWLVGNCLMNFTDTYDYYINTHLLPLLWFNTRKRSYH